MNNIPKKIAYRTLFILAMMLIVVNYVETMVVPALPTIEKDFNTNSTTVAWITSAYLIVGASISPLFGKLGDRYGRKKIYLLAITFYSIAVFLAGISPNIYFLIFARAIQGLGYAIFPLAIAIITDLFPKEKVAMAQGILSATLALGPTLGLLVGSYIVQDFGWQMAFHTAFILSLILLFISYKYVIEIPEKNKENIDYLGALYLLISTVSLLVYLSNGPNIGWFVLPQILLLLIFFVFLSLFYYNEIHTKDQLIKLNLLKIRNISVANVSGFLSGLAMFNLFTTLTYYNQLPKPYGLGLNIIQSGLTMAPVSLVMIILGPFIGRLLSKTGPKPILIIGSILSIIGDLLFIINRSNIFSVIFDTSIISAGIIMLVIPITNIISITLPEEERGVGIGLNTLIRTIGSSMGPVVSTVLMTTYQTWIIIPYNNIYIPIQQIPDQTAFNMIFLVSIIFMVLNLFLSSFIKNYKLEKSENIKIEI